MLSFPEWLSAVRDLHEEARTGQLQGERLAAYRARRDEVMHALLVAQQVTREFGHTARQSMRMAWALQVDLMPPGECTRAVTLDLSVGGFSVLLGAAPPTDRDLEFTIRLPGTAPLKGRARVVAAIAKPGHYRVSFAFTAIGEDDSERLTFFVFDRVLALLSGTPGETRAATAA